MISPTGSPTEREVDDAIAATFPASDPIALRTEDVGLPRRSIFEAPSVQAPTWRPVDRRDEGTAAADVPLGGWWRMLVALQALYYLATGVLPLVSRTAFEALTGPKRDFWLVQSVGGLVCVVGVLLVRSWWRGRISLDAWLAGVLSAAVLLMVDVVFVALDVIDEIYLADAALEIFIIIGHMVGYAMVRGRIDGAITRSARGAAAA